MIPRNKQPLSDAALEEIVNDLHAGKKISARARSKNRVAPGAIPCGRGSGADDIIPWDWSGVVPDLPGLLILGDTRADVIAKAPGVIADNIDAMREVGHPVPAPGGLAVPIAVPAA